MKVKITADSTCDLGEQLAKKYDVGIIPLTVTLGGKNLKDGVEIKPRDIFDHVSAGGDLPKTSAPSVEDYVAFFKNHLEEAEKIVHINITKKASCSYDNACAAAKEFAGRVFPIDSMALSTGQGLLALKVSDFAREGLDAEEIVKRADEVKTRVVTTFVPDSLDYLHKGGRCSLASLMGAKILKLHPLIAMRDGQMYAKKKYIGSIERCLKVYVQELFDEYPRYDKTRCVITHSSCEKEVVDMVKAQVQETFAFNEILETVAGCVVTSHCGKNTLGVLFIHD